MTVSGSNTLTVRLLAGIGSLHPFARVFSIFCGILNRQESQTELLLGVGTECCAGID